MFLGPKMFALLAVAGVGYNEVFKGCFNYGLNKSEIALSN